MIALFTFAPSFCPNCGRKITHGRYSSADYAAGASFSCPDCWLNYQLVDEVSALEATKASGGDLNRMISRG